MLALYTPHRRALTVLYADLEGYALQQREVFIGTAGSVIERRTPPGFVSTPTSSTTARARSANGIWPDPWEIPKSMPPWPS